jgi:hypothetical protein
MTIVYKDEYGTGLYWGASTHPAGIGDTVIIEDEEYVVKSRIFMPEKDDVIIIVGQGSVRTPVAEGVGNSRHNQMRNAIIELTKRQDVTEKKHRALTDQVSSVKRGINQRIQQDKKDSDDQTR